MIIEHNMLAMYTNGQLGINIKKNTKCTEKLASGYRVNRAADDAAGLSISEKMRGQIRGLKQGSRNVMDGISLVQVADGALNETHSVLQRMRKLAVQAANDTNTADDRTTIQEEINQLIEEVDRIANQTEYNSAIYPLLGGEEKSIFPSWLKEYKGITAYSSGPGGIIDGKLVAKGTIVEVTGLGVEDGWSLHLEGGNTLRYNPVNNSHVEFASKIDGTSALYSVRLSDLKVDDDGYIYYDSKSYPGQKCYLLDAKNPGAHSTANHFITTIGGVVPNPFPLNTGTIYTYIKAYANGGANGNDVVNSRQNEVWIQAGANSNQGMYISLVDATARGIGLDDISVMSSIDATNAISNIDGAISNVSEYRSSFGAQQNRLEYAMTVDDNTAENLQDAESKIRDANMADEMVEYFKTNILIQAGQSMLAQANQGTQGVLQLLQ